MVQHLQFVLFSFNRKLSMKVCVFRLYSLCILICLVKWVYLYQPDSAVVTYNQSNHCGLQSDQRRI